MSLVILFFIFLYLALLVGATIFGYEWGKRRKWSTTKRWSAAAIGFLVVFLPMFWDWLPTVWLHSYYCEKYSGLTVNKTLEQWKKENPGVAETLVRQQPPLQVGSLSKYFFQLNQRFRWEIEGNEKLLWLKEDHERLVDGKTGEILARYVDFSTGQPGSSVDHFRDVKIWMRRESCEPIDNHVLRKKFGIFVQHFEDLGEKK